MQRALELARAPSGNGSVLGGVQAAGAGAERDVAALGVVVERRAAVPQAGAAVHALFAIEYRDAAGAGRDGLAGAHLDAHLGNAALAEIGIDEAHMIGEAGRRLHLSAD